jgi:hypothetical protein
VVHSGEARIIFIFFMIFYLNYYRLEGIILPAAKCAVDASCITAEQAGSEIRSYALIFFVSLFCSVFFI